MLAARFHEWGAAPKIEQLEVPVRAAGDVLVQVRAASLSHLDLSVASGTFGMHPPLPYVGGLEGSGLVAAADDLPVGTHVLVRGGGVGLLRDGAWAEQIVVPRKAITVLPAELAPEVAATFYQPTSTAYVALHDVARLQDGERVVVTGAAGAVGAQVVQQALAAGAQVTGVVSSGARLGDIPDGARTVALDDTAVNDAFAQERPFSVLVDTVGGDGLGARTAWVQPGGRAVAVGYTAGTEATLHLPSWLLDDVALLPVNMIRNERRAREVSGELIDRLVNGTLHVAVETFPIDAIGEGLARLASGQVHGRAVVLFGGAS